MSRTEDDTKKEEYEFVKVVGNNVYFYVEVDDETVQDLNTCLVKLDREMRKQYIDWGMDGLPTINIFIQSPGGDLFAGLSAHDHISALKCNTVTIADGQCASAAAIMFLAGNKRLVAKNGYIMIHQLATEFWGKFEDIKDELRNCNMLMENIRTICNEKTQLPESKLKRLLKHDLFMTQEKCIKYGVADGVFPCL
jgi:ATP-dependent Clp endopeptidase proteolytic subunit ClpP